MSIFNKTETLAQLQERRAALHARIVEGQAELGKAREQLAAAIVSGSDSAGVSQEFDRILRLCTVGPQALADLDQAIARRELQDRVDVERVRFAEAQKAASKFESVARKLAGQATDAVRELCALVQDWLPPGVAPQTPYSELSATLERMAWGFEDAERISAPNQVNNLQWYGIVKSMLEASQAIASAARDRLQEAEQALAAFDAARGE